MTIASPALPRPTLVDRVVSRSLATDAALVVAGTALVAILAQVAIPLWPVPVTGQTLAVLLVGASLGAARGAASLSLYAVLGGLGLPIYSDAASGWTVLLGPTGGYIRLPWLAVSLGQLGLPNDLGAVLASGFVPFIIGGVIKAGIAAALMPLLWRMAEKRGRAAE